MDKTTKLIFIAAIAILIAGGGVLYALSNNEKPYTSDSSELTESVESPESGLPVGGGDSQATALAGSPESQQSDTPGMGEAPTGSPETSSVYMIDMKNFSYSVKQIKAKPGEQVTINLTNSGGTHDFVISELGVDSGIIGQGGEQTVRFTVPEDAAGKTFEFFCSVGNHRAQGMVGELVVGS